MSIKDTFVSELAENDKRELELERELEYRTELQRQQAAHIQEAVKDNEHLLALAELYQNDNLSLRAEKQEQVNRLKSILDYLDDLVRNELIPLNEQVSHALNQQRIISALIQRLENEMMAK